LGHRFSQLKGEVLCRQEKNKALIRRFVEDAINKANVAACDEFVALDFAELDPLPG
jgi:hypothetical protein